MPNLLSDHGLRCGARIELDIERLAMGGAGVGRHRGFVIFVPGTAPGERVLARIIRLKKTFAEAELLDVLKASPFRRTPPCPLAGRCGGCSWQHLQYEEQLRQKRELILEALRKFAPSVSTPVAPVFPSPQPLRYRNRIQVHIENGRLGFFMRSSHRLIGAEDCLIADSRLTSIFGDLRQRFPGKTTRLEIFLNESGGVSVSEKSSGDLGFSQVNTGQNEVLTRYLLERLEALSFSRIYELYAGHGNFTFPIHERFTDVPLTAVESNHASHLRALRMMRRTGADPATLTFIEARVEAFLPTLSEMPEALVLLDPPRSGCGSGVVESLGRLRPRSLLYVSCHPVTLARDLRGFQASGYDVSLIQPFDMFPQTDHVEIVTTLERSRP